MSVAVSLVLVVFFLLMNAFFVVAEFSLVRVRKSQVEVLVAENRSGAKYTKLIAEHVNDYLSACQLGITLASLALGWLGEPAVSALIHPALSLLGLPDAVISGIAIALGFIIITALHIVVGELIPKSLAIFSTEKYALLTAAPLVWFYRITYPIMWLFNSITNGVMKLTGHDASKQDEAYTDDELRLLIDESTESGIITPEQDQYLDNIFDLTKKSVEGIMTPRTELVCIDKDAPLKESLALVEESRYTRYPVFEGNTDSIVGFVHIKDLYGISSDDSSAELPIRPIQAVPTSMTTARLLRVFQESHAKIAVVVDEHGGTAGIVTMSDIMEEIIGYDEDESFHDEAAEITEEGHNHFLVKGSLPLDEFADFIGVERFNTAESKTVGGLMFDLFERIPDEGDHISVEHAGVTLHYCVSAMDANRVDEVDVTIERPQSEENT